MDIYFAGGMYYPTEKRTKRGIHGTYCLTNKPMSFGMVHAGDKHKPYLTHCADGLRLTSHHSSLYKVSDDMEYASLIKPRNGGNGASPNNIKLTVGQKQSIQNSIDNNYWFD